MHEIAARMKDANGWAKLLVVIGAVAAPILFIGEFLSGPPASLLLIALPVAIWWTTRSRFTAWLKLVAISLVAWVGSSYLAFQFVHSPPEDATCGMAGLALMGIYFLIAPLFIMGASLLCYGGDVLVRWLWPKIPGPSKSR